MYFRAKLTVYLLYLCPTGVTFFLEQNHSYSPFNTNIPLVNHRSFRLPVLFFDYFFFFDFCCCDYKDIWDYDWNASVCVHVHACLTSVCWSIVQEKEYPMSRTTGINFLSARNAGQNIQIHERIILTKGSLLWRSCILFTKTGNTGDALILQCEMVHLGSS